MSVPMVLVGDINLHEDNRNKLNGLLRKHFNFALKKYPAEQTTPSDSSIVLNFR